MLLCFEILFLFKMLDVSLDLHVLSRQRKFSQYNNYLAYIVISPLNVILSPEVYAKLFY